jgi:hypothetical protein
MQLAPVHTERLIKEMITSGLSLLQTHFPGQLWLSTVQVGIFVVGLDVCRLVTLPVLPTHVCGKALADGTDLAGLVIGPSRLLTVKHIRMLPGPSLGTSNNLGGNHFLVCPTRLLPYWSEKSVVSPHCGTDVYEMDARSHVQRDRRYGRFGSGYTSNRSCRTIDPYFWMVESTAP